MVVFKRKQVVILALVVLIGVAGYLQYTYRQDGSATAGDKLGEAYYVDNEIDNASFSDYMEEAMLEEDTYVEVVADVDTQASKEASDYFVKAKIERNETRSKSEETLKSITQDTAASKETVDTAYNEMMEMIALSDKEMRIDSLVVKMGFEDCVVLFADDGSVDIVVKTPELSSSDVAQIADAVSRQANVAIADIHIKNKY
jgi:stage III sporulation protein AH